MYSGESLMEFVSTQVATARKLIKKVEEALAQFEEGLGGQHRLSDLSWKQRSSSYGAVLKNRSSSTMDEFLTMPTTCTPQQANVLTILNMLVTDMRPLSMVRDQGFKDVIKKFNPEYYENYLPDRSHFTTMMEEKYETTFEKVRQALRAVNGSLTADV
ncbi:uncharacterized protein [Nothobranchius furzeri]|uniref:uncharacterized protein isoform X3 n=1 Tax=Nothobranchius furzeri TaxID=105023 RepID=UPI003904D6DC